MSATRTTPRGGAAAVGPLSQAGHFALHFVEMCAPMCIGFAVGDLVYLWLAGLAGYSAPFTDLPVLSVAVVTVSMTAPMTAWMLYRGTPRRAVIEMSAAMPIVAIALLGIGWLSVVPMENLALLDHGLMMPVMLLRLDLYTGPVGGRAPAMRLRAPVIRRSAIAGLDATRTTADAPIGERANLGSQTQLQARAWRRLRHRPRFRDRRDGPGSRQSSRSTPSR